MAFDRIGRRSLEERSSPDGRGSRLAGPRRRGSDKSAPQQTDRPLPKGVPRQLTADVRGSASRRCHLTAVSSRMSSDDRATLDIWMIDAQGR